MIVVDVMLRVPFEFINVPEEFPRLAEFMVTSVIPLILLFEFVMPDVACSKSDV